MDIPDVLYSRGIAENIEDLSERLDSVSDNQR
jgi:hypothetical protein